MRSAQTVMPLSLHVSAPRAHRRMFADELRVLVSLYISVVCPNVGPIATAAGGAQVAGSSAAAPSALAAAGGSAANAGTHGAQQGTSGGRGSTTGHGNTNGAASGAAGTGSTPSGKTRSGSTADGAKAGAPPVALSTAQQEAVVLVQTYFSDAYLSADEAWLKTVRAHVQGFVDLAVVEAFAEMAALGLERKDLVAALKTSKKLIVAKDGSAVRRKEPMRRVNRTHVPARTVVVENIAADATEDSLRATFETCGRVNMINMIDPDLPAHHERIASLLLPKGVRPPGPDNRIATVEFSRDVDAVAAVEKYNNEADWRGGLRVRVLGTRRRAGSSIGGLEDLAPPPANSSMPAKGRNQRMRGMSMVDQPPRHTPVKRAAASGTASGGSGTDTTGAASPAVAHRRSRGNSADLAQSQTTPPLRPAAAPLLVPPPELLQPGNGPALLPVPAGFGPARRRAGSMDVDNGPDIWTGKVESLDGRGNGLVSVDGKGTRVPFSVALVPNQFNVGDSVAFQLIVQASGTFRAIGVRQAGGVGVRRPGGLALTGRRPMFTRHDSNAGDGENVTVRHAAGPNDTRGFAVGRGQPRQS